MHRLSLSPTLAQSAPHAVGATQRHPPRSVLLRALRCARTGMLRYVRIGALAGLVPVAMAACGTSSTDSARVPTSEAAAAGDAAARSAAAPVQPSARAPRPGGVQGAGAVSGVDPGERDDDGYLARDWLELLPANELEAMQNAPAVQHIGKQRMTQTGTYTIVDGVLDQKTRLPGYVVPLETDDGGRISEFFFVPNYGACIHVPPPPPNQMVHVRLRTPTEVPDIFTAYWLKGTLHAQKVVNTLAGAAYVMDDATLAPYDGEQK